MLRIAIALLICACALAPKAHAEDPSGTVRGKVTLLKKRLFGGLAPSSDASGVVVYVTGYADPPPDEVAVLEQENERFVPRLLPIVAGQSVEFPNRDRFYHNVFSVSPVESFDLGQYKATDSPRRQRFEKPGLVPVYCNIHPQMISYVVVLENRAFALTGEDGAFELPRVRAGRIEVNAWIPGAQRASRALELAPGAEVAVELELAQTQVIPPHPRKDGTPYPPPPKYSGD
jgi:plastocyanin